MNSGDQVVITFDVPSQAVARAAGHFVTATTAFVTLFQNHPETKAGLRVFGLTMKNVIGENDGTGVTIIFRASKDTKHKASDAIGFFGGIWKDLANAIQ